MTLVLVPIAADADVGMLAARLAPGFGGDEAPARAILEQTLTLLTEYPRAYPWGCYIAELEGRPVGTCAFKCPPDEDGEVELAYMTFPAFQGRGHATQMAGALFRIAEQWGAAMVVALTLPFENASNRALGRNGFTLAGEEEDPEDGPVWRWEKPVAR